jgi:hypothetical protein
MKNGTTRWRDTIMSFTVRMKGLEPTHLAALDPKSSVSTNSTTSAIVSSSFAKNRIANINVFFIVARLVADI